MNGLDARHRQHEMITSGALTRTAPSPLQHCGRPRAWLGLHQAVPAPWEAMRLSRWSGAQ